MPMWTQTAPANIALIKYMGKSDDLGNLPTNDSLSYTLTSCLTKVELTLKTMGCEDSWSELCDETYPYKPWLNIQNQQRFIQHLDRIKCYFEASDYAFNIRSANNFPSSCGIASSASSFAALTLCAAQALCELNNCTMPTMQALAMLSRQGSGSSCRSFLQPWSYWSAKDNSVTAPIFPYNQLLHSVFIVSKHKKSVSSSLAHRRVLTSPLFADRPARAKARMTLLLQALHNKEWPHMYELCHSEWQDMHALFTTCSEPFDYLQDQSRIVIKYFEDLWQRIGDGPLVTLDAGPNVHVLFRPDQFDQQQRSVRELNAQGLTSL